MSNMNRFRFGAAFRALAVAGLALAAAACDDDPAAPFTIGGTGTVEAFAYYDADDDGVFDPVDDDYALEGIRISVVERGTSTVLATVVTDADGRVELSGIPAGTHEAVVDLSTVPDDVRVCQDRANVTIYPGETQFLGVVGRAGCLTLIGTVREQIASGDLALGDGVVVRGTVTVGQGVFHGNRIFVQDATGGFFVVDVPTALALEAGDSVEISGVIEQSGSTRELQIAAAGVEVLGEGTVPAPLPATGQEVFDAAYEGSLVTVDDVVVTNIAVFGGGFSANVTVEAPDGTTFVIRFDNQAGAGVNVEELFTVGEAYDVTGVLASFQGDGQLKPRSAADIVPQ